MLSILINTEKDFGINSDKVRGIVRQFFRRRRIDNIEVSVAFVDRETMKRLNANYRGQEYPTTVLSFPQGEYQGQGKSEKKKKVKAWSEFPPDPGGLKRLGDLLVCPPLAEEENLSLGFLLKHGLSNLLPKVPTAKNLRT